MKQWTIIVDFSDHEYEATAFVSADNENDQLHWASNDPHTLMAAIGRDLASEVKS